jgi:hypothetical protein
MTHGNDSAFASKRVRKLRSKDFLGNESVNFITEDDYGMTKREYFAAMALSGICMNTDYRLMNLSSVTTDAVRHADALIEALNKEAK